MDRQVSMGKDAVGGCACATKKRMISPDFESGRGFLSQRTLHRFALLGEDGERNSFFCHQTT